MEMGSGSGGYRAAAGVGGGFGCQLLGESVWHCGIFGTDMQLHCAVAACGSVDMGAVASFLPRGVFYGAFLAGDRVFGAHSRLPVFVLRAKKNPLCEKQRGSLLYSMQYDFIVFRFGSISFCWE